MLTHHLPAEPGYLRVKVRRRLERIGAVPLKNSAVTRLRSRLASIAEIDFFGAPGREAAWRSIAAALAAGQTGADLGPNATAGALERPVGRTWVTRRGVKVDRIASAWLILRRIDPAATFRFVTPHGYRPAKDEKFGRVEAGGIASVLDGIARTCPDDEERLTRGAAVFDGLYEHFRAGGE